MYTLHYTRQQSFNGWYSGTLKSSTHSLRDNLAKPVRRCQTVLGLCCSRRSRRWQWCLPAGTYKMCKALFNHPCQHTEAPFSMARCPSYHPTESNKAQKAKTWAENQKIQFWRKDEKKWDHICLRVKCDFSGALEEFWMDALPNASSDSYGCQWLSNQILTVNVQHLNQ